MELSSDTIGRGKILPIQSASFMEIGEYAGRYDRVATRMNEAGFAVLFYGS